MIWSGLSLFNSPGSAANALLGLCIGPCKIVIMPYSVTIMSVNQEYFVGNFLFPQTNIAEHKAWQRVSGLFNLQWRPCPCDEFLVFYIL